jgi:uncharacterized membrane protein YccF (DUF307 family)
MKIGANIIWILLGGWLLGLAWYLSAIAMAISIIGLPWARACWEIGTMSLAPFGKDVISQTELTGKSTAGGTVFAFIANLIWLPVGVTLATMHVLHGALMFCTIIGIPFALQDFKLAGISLFPVGKRVVSLELVTVARATNAQAELDRLRGR